MSEKTTDTNGIVTAWPEIIGHGTRQKDLEIILNNRRIPHALLFSGPDGVGKATVAKAFAKRVFATLGDSHQAALVEVGNHPDLHYLDQQEQKKGISVEQVRDLCGVLQMKPYSGACSFAIIDNAHEMNSSAANALLKSLEEPCNNSFLILITHAPHRLPETIVSRCQRIHFGALTKKECATIIDRSLKDSLSSKEIENLNALCEDSVGLLSKFFSIEQKTKKIIDLESSKTTLGEVLEQYHSLHKSLEKFCEPFGSSKCSPNEALQVASYFAGGPHSLDLAWATVRTVYRRKLRAAEVSQANRWSGFLSHALTAEKRTKERNVNPLLEFTSLFLELC